MTALAENCWNSSIMWTGLPYQQAAPKLNINFPLKLQSVREKKKKTSSQSISCCNCNKKISSLKTKIICRSSGLKQRPASCKKQWYLESLSQHEKGTINLTFFDYTLKQIIGSYAKHESVTLNKLHDRILSLPKFRITYNNETKIVLNNSNNEHSLKNVKSCRNKPYKRIV